MCMCSSPYLYFSMMSGGGLQPPKFCDLHTNHLKPNMFCKKRTKKKVLDANSGAFSILGIRLNPGFGKYLSLEFCCFFLSKRGYKDRALGVGPGKICLTWPWGGSLTDWVSASDLADATKISSNARWMEVLGILGHFPFLSPIYVTSISGQTCSSTNVEILI